MKSIEELDQVEESRDRRGAIGAEPFALASLDFGGGPPSSDSAEEIFALHSARGSSRSYSGPN